MSKNYSKSKREAEKKRLEQKKFMLQLQKEIIDLENKIKHDKIENFKIDSIKNLKISARILQLVAPYILTASIAIGGIKLLGGGFPFYRDDFTKYLHYMKEFDNNGNIRTEQQYESFSDTSAILYYYGKWEQVSESTYSRIKQTYSLKNISEEDIVNLFNGEITISDLLGNPTEYIIETNNNLSDDEINQNEYMQAKMYDVNKEEFIIVKETVRKNITMTVVIILCTLLAEILTLQIRLSISDFDITDRINRIKAKYPHINTEELTKKLEIKKSNYNRLVR